MTDTDNKTKRQDFVELLTYEYRIYDKIAEIDKLGGLLSAGKADWFLAKMNVTDVIDGFLNVIEPILFEDLENYGLGNSQRVMPAPLNALCDYAIDVELDKFQTVEQGLSDWREIQLAIQKDGVAILHYLTAEESINGSDVLVLP